MERDGAINDTSRRTYLGVSDVASDPPAKSDIASSYRNACDEDASCDYEERDIRFYLLSAKWMDSFLSHASSLEKMHPSTYNEKKENSTPPLKMINTGFLEEEVGSAEKRLKSGLQHGKDYALVGPHVWKILSSHGCDVEIPLPVVRVGDDGSFAVEVYSRKERKMDTYSSELIPCCPALVVLPLGARWTLQQQSRWEESKEMAFEHTSTYDDLVSFITLGNKTISVGYHKLLECFALCLMVGINNSRYLRVHANFFIFNFSLFSKY